MFILDGSAMCAAAFTFRILIQDRALPQEESSRLLMSSTSGRINSRVKLRPHKKASPKRCLCCVFEYFDYSMISVTTPEPTVLPPVIENTSSTGISDLKGVLDYSAVNRPGPVSQISKRTSSPVTFRLSARFGPMFCSSI